MYVRKSSEGDDRQVQSIDDQVEVLTELIKRYDIKIKKELIFTEAKSAKKPNNRPEFNRMIELIRDGKIQGLVVWKIDRLSRNPAENGILQQLLQDGKIKHIKAHDRDYKPEDNAVIFSLEASMGNQYVRELSVNVKRGMRATVRDGRIPGVAPAGYLNRQVDKKKFVDKDPDRWPLIRKAFDTFLTGNYTVMEVRQMLDEWGYKTRRSQSGKTGGSSMSRAAMYKVFNNRKYLGVVPHPDFPDDPSKDTKGQFPAMITIQEYNRVQSLLGNKTRVKNVSAKQFELKGLFRCGVCTCMVTAHVVPKKLVTGKINYHTYYHCTRKKSPCDQKAVRENVLFDQIDDLLSKYELTPKLYEWAKKAIKDIAEKEIEQRDDIKIAQYRSIESIQKQLDKLLELLVSDVISEEVYSRKAEPLEAELAKKKEDHKNNEEKSKYWYELVGLTFKKLCDASESFMEGDLNTRRDILMSIGCNPTIVNKSISIEPFEWLIPIQKELPSLKAQIEKVETENSNKKNKSSLDREQMIMSSWCG